MLCNVTLAPLFFSPQTVSLLIASMTSSTALSVRLPPAERVRSLRSGFSQHSYTASYLGGACTVRPP